MLEVELVRGSMANMRHNCDDRSCLVLSSVLSYRKTSCCFPLVAMLVKTPCPSNAFTLPYPPLAARQAPFFRKKDIPNTLNAVNRVTLLLCRRATIYFYSGPFYLPYETCSVRIESNVHLYLQETVTFAYGIV